MELSPLAKEKLARIGDLSPAEKEKLKVSEKLTQLLAGYFTNKIDVNSLWLELKKYKEQGHESIVREAQRRLLNAITLTGNQADFEHCRSALLGCETIKEHSRYPDLEHGLKMLESLRLQYQQEKERAFNNIKRSIQQQVEMAAKQVLRQSNNRNISVDVEGSVEATARTSPQWRNFLIEHDRIYGQKFDELIARIKRLL